MTIEEFDKARFTGQMKCKYKGKEYDIISVDFEERIIGIFEVDDPRDPEANID